MNPGAIFLSRLEFVRFEVEVNRDYVNRSENSVFPQLEFDFHNVTFDLGSNLDYPEEEVGDPRHFTLSLKLSIRQEKQSDGVVLPYSFNIEGVAYLHFRGSDEGLMRFKYVRGTGYPMLYSAFREQIANFTSRSEHGLWFLPSPTFTKMVDENAPQDLLKWEAAKNSREDDMPPVGFKPKPAPVKKKAAVRKSNSA
ncbi:hypothetical protein ACFQ09_24095 [Massilia norwichensis]|uniref:Uncharacterized protein n=1 Tax=Massilia norwichensis TaxID=1442366 RepID=A0ABT2ADC7_9BURK|nr:hypothetical protein [Massilia norwichensis]MCS0592224.1 hypothetical protein [Massilia norwichensis]